MRKSWTRIAWGDGAEMTMKSNEEAFKKMEMWLIEWPHWWIHSCIHLSAYTVFGEFYLTEIMPQKNTKKKHNLCIFCITL